MYAGQSFIISELIYRFNLQILQQKFNLTIQILIINYQIMKSQTTNGKKQKFKSQSKTNPNQGKIQFQFERIRFLKSLKDKFEILPTQANYKIENETQYLRIITQILECMPKIRLQEIEYIVTNNSLKKLFVQLNNLTFHKQIVISLLRQLLRGCESFISLIQGELYQILSFMIQIDGLVIKPVNQVKNLDKQSDLSILSKNILASSVLGLIKSILSWYCMGNRAQGIKNKYSKLKQTLDSCKGCP